MSPPHLVLDITGHGYGHLAQVAPVLAALAERLSFALTVRTQIAPDIWRPALPPAAAAAPPPAEPVLVMDSAVDIRVDDTLAAYARLDATYTQVLQHEARTLAALAPTLVLADVPFLSLAAAAAAGVPAVALSSLNWADVLEWMAPPGWGVPLLRRMRAAYNSARHFIRVEPAMPMSWLVDAVDVGPVAALGRSRRGFIDARCGARPGEHLGLLSVGGIPTELPLQHWPVREGWRWLVREALLVPRPDMLSLERLGLSFRDALASCDLVITKPGYGTFVEAACNGTPVLYASRPNWPEEPRLSAWLERHTRAQAMPYEQLFGGRIAAAADALLARAPPPLTTATGNEQAAALVQAQLTRAMPVAP